MEFGVINPPAQNEAAAVLRTETSRKNVEFFQRKAVANLCEKLEGAQQDAMREIAIAPSVYDNPGKVRVMNYGRVSGMGPEEISAWMLDLKADYEQWCRLLASLSPLALSITRRVCQDEETIDAIRRAESMKDGTIIKMLVYALNEFAIIRGYK